MSIQARLKNWKGAGCTKVVKAITQCSVVRLPYCKVKLPYRLGRVGDGGAT